MSVVGAVIIIVIDPVLGCIALPLMLLLFDFKLTLIGFYKDS